VLGSSPVRAHDTGRSVTEPLEVLGVAATTVPALTPAALVATRQASAVTFWVALTDPVAVALVVPMSETDESTGRAGVLLVAKLAAEEK
jgi:hypothetical protein